MEIIYRELSSLVPNPRNPRKQSPKGVRDLAVSIENNPRFFEARPILLSDRTGKLVIIAGERRSEAAKLLGMKEVPTILLSGLSEAEEDEIMIRDNTHAGIWDESKLTQWDKGQLQGWNVDGVKWPKEETEIKEDDFDPDKKVKSRVKPGELWQLGKHRLMCGDSTDLETVKKLMGRGEIKAEMAFTSPPYNAGDSEKLSGNTHFEESKYLNYGDAIADYKELIVKSTENATISAKYVFINLQLLAGNKMEVIDYLYEMKHNLCDILIWKKTGAPAMAKRVCNSEYEFIFVFSNENNSRAIGTKDFRGTESNVFECPPNRKNDYAEIHAATFSVEFVSHYMTAFSNRGESVLDLFGGTGTTLIAAEQLGRKCYMMELDPHYCDVIIDRWEQFTGQKAKRIE